jgi:uncharacterized protein (TIGR03083 family)
MDRRRYIECLQTETARVAALAARGDLSVIAGACAPMTVAEVVVHLGQVNRRATARVRDGADPGKFPPGPDEGVDIATWFAEGATDLVDALESADPDGPLWTLDGPGAHVFSCPGRRQAHESAMHRWDAEHALGDAAPIDADLAADGINELLLGFTKFLHPKGAGEKVHLHATDVEGEWLVRFEPSGLTVEQVCEQGDVTLRGKASDLLLFAWNRVPAAEPFDVVGDAARANVWRQQLAI